MVEEEGAVMGGLLVGLNVIDANLCIKGEDLDSQVSADRVFVGLRVLAVTPRFSLRETSRSGYACDQFLFPIQVGVIDFSLYLKDPANSETPKE